MFNTLLEDISELNHEIAKQETDLVDLRGERNIALAKLDQYLKESGPQAVLIDSVTVLIYRYHKEDGHEIIGAHLEREEA